MAILSNLISNLNKESAYCLGAVLTACESYNDVRKKYWMVPIRHNPGQVSNHEIKQHFNFINIIAKQLGAEIKKSYELGSKKGFSAGKIGFSMIFESDLDCSIENILSQIPNLNYASEDIKRAFLIGVFDGRSSLDKNTKTNIIRNIAVDCENKKVHEIISFLLKNFNIIVSPQNQSRERVQGGTPRKNQLRIPKRYLDTFATQIGFISPFRFKAFRNCFVQDIPFIKNDDFVLPGLKSLSQRKQKITVTETTEDTFISDIDINNLNSTRLTYNETPKPKMNPVLSKGRVSYPRNIQVAVNALALAEYKCEINNTHKTFIRKRNNKPYTEPHHLVPMAFSNRYVVSLDVEENIVSLCSHCHNLIHYGKDSSLLLQKLYDDRKGLLMKAGIDIDLEDLYEMYGLY